MKTFAGFPLSTNFELSVSLRGDILKQLSAFSYSEIERMYKESDNLHKIRERMSAYSILRELSNDDTVGTFGYTYLINHFLHRSHYCATTEQEFGLLYFLLMVLGFDDLCDRLAREVKEFNESR